MLKLTVLQINVAVEKQSVSGKNPLPSNGSSYLELKTKDHAKLKKKQCLLFFVVVFFFWPYSMHFYQILFC